MKKQCIIRYVDVLRGRHQFEYKESNEQEKSVLLSRLQRAVVAAESDRNGMYGVRLLAANAK